MDKYADFQELSENETEGVDFRVAKRVHETARTAVVAPHGGAIEPGTTELAVSIAGPELNYATFDGLKASGNVDLHITSTRFDEPRCVEIVARSSYVLTVHGEGSLAEVAYIGGLDESLATAIEEELKRSGFSAGAHDNTALTGKSAQNICNRGTRGMGVQLELSRGLRKTLFRSLDAQGRKETTPAFEKFVTAIRSGLRGGGAL